MAIAEVALAALEAAPPTNAVPEVRKSPGVATPEGIARFEAAMGGADVNADADGAELRFGRSIGVDGVPAGNGLNTVGDRILNGLESVSDSFKMSVDKVGAGTEMPSMADMMRWHTTTMQMSVTFELVGKTISRSTQNIDQLVRIS